MEDKLDMRPTIIGGKRKMPKARIETNRYISVPIEGINGKERARRWLCDFLIKNELIAKSIEHFPNRIVAVVVTEREIIF